MLVGVVVAKQVGELPRQVLTKPFRPCRPSTRCLRETLDTGRLTVRHEPLQILVLPHRDFDLHVFLRKGLCAKRTRLMLPQNHVHGIIFSVGRHYIEARAIRLSA